jgi:putative zinc finger/helix-turn-helix YgiT family protein
MNHDRTTPRNDAAPLLVCPECGEQAVRTEMTPQTFNYGHGEDAVPITADVPLRVCSHCGFEYFDKEGQEARHEAVCRHLRVLTPKQIRALRELHGLSRTDFADLTGLGEATIARWERGSLIQNVANDRYLRLLGHDDNMSRLRRLAKAATTPPPPEPGRQPTFPTLSAERTTTLRVEQVSFRL